MPGAAAAAAVPPTSLPFAPLGGAAEPSDNPFYHYCGGSLFAGARALLSFSTAERRAFARLE